MGLRVTPTYDHILSTGLFQFNSKPHNRNGTRMQTHTFPQKICFSFATINKIWRLYPKTFVSVDFIIIEQTNVTRDTSVGLSIGTNMHIFHVSWIGK